MLLAKGVGLVYVLQKQLEFAVQMTCESCADKVRAALEGKPGNIVSKFTSTVKGTEMLWLHRLCAAASVCHVCPFFFGLLKRML